MLKRGGLEQGGGLALPRSLGELLLPRRHLIGKTADERARLAYTMGLLVFCMLLTGGLLLWELPQSSLPPAVLAVNLTALALFVIDLVVFLRYGRGRWLDVVLTLQLAGLVIASVITRQQLELLPGLTAPASLLMFMVSLRSAYLATAGAVVVALLLGALRANGILPGPESVSAGAFMGPAHVVVCLWILGNLPLMVSFESRRQWASDEASLIASVLRNVQQEMKALLVRICTQLLKLLDEPELSAATRESVQEAEASAKRLSRVIDQLTTAPEAELGAAAEASDQREPTAGELSGISDKQRAQRRFFIQISYLFLLTTSVLLAAALWFKGFDHTITKIALAAFAVFLLSALLIHRSSNTRFTILWVSLEMVTVTALGTIVSGHLTNAIWFGLVPILLLYLTNARWAMVSALLLIALTTVLAITSGYAVSPIEPLTTNKDLDHTIISAAFIATTMFMFGYFERDRMAAATITALKSSALAEVSHELRTPLNGILGMLSLAREDLPARGMQPARLSAAEDGGLRLLRLVDDTLRFASLLAGQVQRRVVAFELAQLGDGLQQQAARLMEQRRIDIALDYPASPGEQLLGEEERLGKILADLLEWVCEHCTGQAVDLRMELQAQAGDRRELVVEIVGRSPSKSEDDTLPGLSEFLTQPREGFDSHVLRVALCRTQVTFLGGQLEVLRQERKGLLLRVPLRRQQRAA